MNRRSFIASILAAGVAPAFIGARVLMPVRKVWTFDEFADLVRQCADAKPNAILVGTDLAAGPDRSAIFCRDYAGNVIGRELL